MHNTSISDLACWTPTAQEPNTILVQRIDSIWPSQSLRASRFANSCDEAIDPFRCSLLSADSSSFSNRKRTLKAIFDVSLAIPFVIFGPYQVSNLISNADCAGRLFAPLLQVLREPHSMFRFLFALWRTFSPANADATESN